MHEAIKTSSAPEPRGKRFELEARSSFLGNYRLTEAGNVVKGTLAEEAAQTLENIHAIMETAEGTIADIVHIL